MGGTDNGRGGTLMGLGVLGLAEGAGLAVGARRGNADALPPGGGLEAGGAIATGGGPLSRWTRTTALGGGGALVDGRGGATGASMTMGGPNGRVVAMFVSSSSMYDASVSRSEPSRSFES